jgi:hypothetical protein
MPAQREPLTRRFVVGAGDGNRTALSAWEVSATIRGLRWLLMAVRRHLRGDVDRARDTPEGTKSLAVGLRGGASPRPSPEVPGLLRPF